MSITRKIISIGSVLVVLLLLLVGRLYADDLEFVAMRYDRLTANQIDVPILIVIEPSALTNTQTETTFRITFDNDITVGTPGEITTSTASIPSTFKGNALIAMPGLSATATSVSSQQVDFSISDLTDGNYYAFYITAGIDTGAAGNYSSVIETRDGGGLIDTKTVGAEIIADDTVVVSATVPVGANIADVNVSGDINEYTILQQGDEVVITVSYRLNVGSARPFRLRAYWDDPIYVDNESHSADAIQYIDGSANKTPDGTLPVIDVQNNMIQWNISSLEPSSEYQTVTFKLRVRANLGVRQKLKALIFADGEYEGTGVPRDEFGFYILKVPTTTTTTPFPTLTPGAQVPVEEEARFIIEDVDVIHVATSEASLRITTNKKSNVRVLYGTSEKNLSMEIEDSTFSLNHRISLTSLFPDTRYYFKIVASEIEEENTLTGRKVVSDIYTFKTTALSTRIDFGEATLTWKEVLLAKTDVNNTAREPVVLMKGKPIEMNFVIRNPEDLQSARLTFVRKEDVLGITNSEPVPPEYSVSLLQTVSGVFSAEVLTPYEIGEHAIRVDVRDVYGSLYTQYLPFRIFTSAPITISSEKTSKGIEAARVFIERFNPVTGMYENIAKSFTYNDKTNEHGYLDVNLPKAQYRLTVNTPGYAQAQKFITINAQTHSYPMMQLEPTWGIYEYLTFVAVAVQDLGVFTADGLEQLTSSYRVRFLALLFYTLVTGMNLFTTVIKKHIHEHETLESVSSKKILSIFLRDSVYVINILLIAAGGMYAGASVYFGRFSEVLILILICLLYVMSFVWIVYTDLVVGNGFKRIDPEPQGENVLEEDENTCKNISS